MSEADYWRNLIQDLQDAGKTAAWIAEQLDIDPRHVFRIKAGDRPKGLKAIRLAELHRAHCP